MKRRNKGIALVLLVVLILAVGCQHAAPQPKAEVVAEAETNKVPEKKIETTSEISSKEEAPQQTQVDVGAFLKEIQGKIAKHWPHMEKVWPGHAYKEHNAIFFYLDENMKTKSAWLLNAKEIKQLTEKEVKGIEVPMPGGYAQVDFQGKPSIAIGLDDGEMSQNNAVNETYRLATHELVHFYYQEGASNQTGSRAQVFPLEIKPRLYRQMVYSHLISAYENPKEADEHLAKAKYWNEKWVSEYKSEADKIAQTDIVEGTAKYIENVGDFIEDNNDPAAFRQKAIENIAKGEKFDSADGESYELGYVAALLLDERNPDWKKTFYEEGKTLVNKLLESVEAKEEKMDPKFEKELSDYLQSVNKEAKEDLKDYLAAEENKKIPFLRITASSGSSYAMRDHYSYKGKDVLTQYANSYQLKEGKIDLNQVIVVSETKGDVDHILLPLTMEHKLENGKLNINTPNVKVEGVKVKQTEEDGRIFYTTE